MQNIRLKVINEAGLHARPAAEFVRAAQFKCKLTVRNATKDSAGMDELSMSPRQVPLVKQVVRNWSLTDAQELARRALEMDSADAIRRAVSES